MAYYIQVCTSRFACSHFKNCMPLCEEQKDQSQLIICCEIMAESPPCRSKLTSVGLSVSLAVAGSRSPPKGSKLSATASIAREFLWL